MQSFVRLLLTLPGMFGSLSPPKVLKDLTNQSCKSIKSIELPTSSSGSLASAIARGSYSGKAQILATYGKLGRLSEAKGEEPVAD